MGCRTGGIQDRWDAGKEKNVWGVEQMVCRTSGMRDRRDEGQEG